MNKIAIIYTTFLRDTLMRKTVESILEFWIPNSKLFIIDQGYRDKKKDLFYSGISSDDVSINYVPFDSGLSYARNYGVQLANLQNFDYCLLTADSILFTSVLPITKQELFKENIGIVGFDLENRIHWEGSLDFTGNEFMITQVPNKKYYDIITVDVCRNFFLAKTSCLIENKWDENLKLLEHEDFFWRLKQTKWKVLYDGTWSAKYIGDRYKTEEYLSYRNRMYKDFKRILQEKYNITGWVKYVK